MNFFMSILCDSSTGMQYSVTTNLHFIYHYVGLVLIFDLRPYLIYIGERFVIIFGND